MSTDSTIPYKITVETAEPWMDRAHKISLTTQLTPVTASSTTFYLDDAEAVDLITKLQAVI